MFLLFYTIIIYNYEKKVNKNLKFYTFFVTVQSKQELVTNQPYSYSKASQTLIYREGYPIK